MSKPIIPEMIDFGSEFPETPAIKEIPKIPIEKYSTEVKFATNFVISDAQSKSKTAENNPPNTDEKRDKSCKYQYIHERRKGILNYMDIYSLEFYLRIIN